MIVWRLAPARHVRQLDGAGNRKTGARWNSGRGRGVVFTSLNVATCVLETFVHFGAQLRLTLPLNFMLAKIRVPDDAGIVEIGPDEIPPDADQPGPGGRTWYQRAGDAWLDERKHLVLLAPSAVVPQERNAMLNPQHGRMGEVEVVSCEPFRFDPRLAARL